jgi:hypothetical protein
VTEWSSESLRRTPERIPIWILRFQQEAHDLFSVYRTPRRNIACASSAPWSMKTGTIASPRRYDKSMPACLRIIEDTPQRLLVWFATGQLFPAGKMG